MNRFISTALTLLSAVCVAHAADIDAAPIHYSTAPEDNAAARLIKKLEAGEVALKPEPKFGYARELLKALDVPESSQVLVFSKTSLQRSRIGPRTPRAVYFNDDVYVGFCQNGDVLEVSAADPALGTVFYTVDQKKTDRARLTRQGDTCLICHASSQNQGLPGHVVRSVYADATGNPILASGTYRIDQTSPLRQRWGGWYVSGTCGKQIHLGNATFEERGDPDHAENAAGLNVTDLSRFFKTANYPTPHSDVVAHLVLEHQAQMHNLLVRASFFTRQALFDEAELNKALNRNEPGHTESTSSRIKSACEPLVRFMLFSEEVELGGPVRGTSTFAEEFAKRGPFDRRGRSLRDFDLETRIFKYPCSYLIYSESFRRLPAEARAYMFRRLGEVLTGKDQSKEFAHLTGHDRRAMREILRDTLPESAAYLPDGH
jgi:hypothetical protein